MSRMRSFVMSALRGARWPLKYEALKKAYVEDGINPVTGKRCKLHKCPECQQLFPQKEMRVDHRDPVVPINHDWPERPHAWLGYDWNELLQRLYCELDGLLAICKGCHDIKSAEERQLRNQQPDLFE